MWAVSTYNRWPAEKQRLHDLLSASDGWVPRRCRVECRRGHMIYRAVVPHGQELAVVPSRPGGTSGARQRAVASLTSAHQYGAGTVRQRYACPRRGCGLVVVARAERVAQAYVEAIEAGRAVLVAGVDF